MSWCKFKYFIIYNNIIIINTNHFDFMELPANFPMPVAVCFAMNIQLWTFGSQVAHMRKKIFNQDFMKK